MEDKGTYIIALGLGAAIFFSTLNIRDNLKNIEEKIKRISPNLKIENVIGNETPDKFYEIDGRRVYLEIDGKPVEEYLKR